FLCFQAEDGIRVFHVTGVQSCALPISRAPCLPAEAGGRSTDLAPQPSPAVPPGGVGLLRIDERLARRSCRWVGGHGAFRRFTTQIGRASRRATVWSPQARRLGRGKDST